ncbi:352_t:CDS:1, partial [Gigaspora margarita]
MSLKSLINQLENLRQVAYFLKINLETPLFQKDGIEEGNGLIMLSKESAVQEAKYFIKTRVKKAISKESLRIKIIKKINIRMNNILQLDDELKIIKELEEIIYEIDNEKLNLNYQFM